MAHIAEEMRSQFFAVRVALLHRIGVVPVGEASVVVAAASVHRREAMAAVQFGIDTLKAKVPIWKKVRNAFYKRTYTHSKCVLIRVLRNVQEIYEQGPSQWKVNCECIAHRAQLKSGSAPPLDGHAQPHAQAHTRAQTGHACVAETPPVS